MASTSDYEDIKAEAHEIKVNNINPYLIDSKDIVVLKRTKPISNVPEMQFGNMANDGGHLIIEETEINDFLEKEPNAQKFIKPLLGSVEFINSKRRYCLWLQDIKPNEIRELKEIQKRILLVKEVREKSSRDATKKLASVPYLFGEIRQPKTDYLLIPRVSSENRYYIPIGYVDRNTIVTDRCAFVGSANLFLFGVLTSDLHMTWMKYTCGRLKSDYNYSIQIVYNNYPFPKEASDKQKERVEKAAQAVLDTRSKYPDSSLADLYDPLAMPPDLVKAHKELDKAVDLCYRSQPFANERTRIEFLFDLYSQYVSPLQAEMDKQNKRAKKMKA